MSMHRRLVAAIVVALALFQTVALAEPAGVPQIQRAFTTQRSRSQMSPGDVRLVVGVRPRSQQLALGREPSFEARATKWGAGLRMSAVGGNAYRVIAPAGADPGILQQRIAADPNVAYVEPDYRYTLKLRPNDSLYPRLYALPRIGAETAWDRTTGRSDVTVAVIDTGVFAAHPDLGSNVVAGTNFVAHNGDASDDEGHGTHTAGIIAAVGNNGRGVAGLCWQCHILPIKALDSDGGGFASDLAAGIRYAVDRGAKIINLSLGGDRDSRVLRDAVTYAANHGVLIIAAAGNEAQEGNPVEYPAAYPEVIAVGATDQNDKHAPFSNYNSYVSISAPGVNIGSTLWEKGKAESYGSASGTSEAAPMVSGVAALIWSVNPSLPATEVRRILLETADDLGQPGRDPYFGAGRVNVARAVAAAIPPAVPTPQPSSTVEPSPSPSPSGESITFPETGHSLRGEFRRFWEANGGLPVFGYPIGEEQVEQTPEGSFVVQYFERNRFELHPEKQPPYNVLLGRLGDTILKRKGIDWWFEPKGQPKDGCQFFADTGHTVCEPFLSYWRNHGLKDPALDGYGRALALFGLPITEPRIETNSSGDTVMTQWFERARFEDHGAKGVLLGLLGNELRASPPSPCPDIPPAKDGVIRPSPCLPMGTEMSIDVSGFKPGEQISFWLTAPDGAIFGGQRTLTANAEGTLKDQRYPTTALAPGRWYWVFQGLQSSHQSIIFFHIYQP